MNTNKTVDENKHNILCQHHFNRLSYFNTIQYLNKLWKKINYHSFLLLIFYKIVNFPGEWKSVVSKIMEFFFLIERIFIKKLSLRK